MAQEIKALKQEMERIKADPGLSEADRTWQERLKLMELWRATGQAKVKAAKEHVLNIIKQGAAPTHSSAEGFVLSWLDARHVCTPCLTQHSKSPLHHGLRSFSID